MTDQERVRFRQLWNRQTEGETLSDNEQAELSALIAVIEQEEAAYLRPANERLEAAAIALEERNRALLELVQRKEALANRLSTIVTEADAERTAIDAEVQRLLRSGPAVAAGA